MYEFIFYDLYFYWEIECRNRTFMQVKSELNSTKNKIMKVSVWDTYVTRADGEIMHFDILVENTVDDEQLIYSYGNKYLKTKSFKTGALSSKECKFCHIEEAPEDVANKIDKDGFFIIEMENCN